MEITRKDVLWNYSATLVRVGANFLILPFILNLMPAEKVGIWSVFTAISAFSILLDFGFGPTFTRNVSYIFSGVKELLPYGVVNTETAKAEVDYGLLKGAINAMKWFYIRMSLVLLLFLGTIGTFYIIYLLKSYSGNKNEVYIAWAILCIISSYNLFTSYYDALLFGRGMIKRSKQIVVFGQVVYLIFAIALIISGQDLIAIISAQALSVLIVRELSKRSFFTESIRHDLARAQSVSRAKLISTLAPNALKIGITSFGGFLVQKSSLVIGSFYLTLSEIASFGITMQIISIISSLSLIYSSTYLPKVSQFFVKNDQLSIKRIYLRSQIIMLLSFLFFGISLVLFGQPLLRIIDSKTQLIPVSMISIYLLVSLLETNHSLAGSILLAKNIVPFFKASIFAGAMTIIFLFSGFKFLHVGLWTMILAQGLANIYNNIRWPSMVYKLLQVKRHDIKPVYSER